MGSTLAALLLAGCATAPQPPAEPAKCNSTRCDEGADVLSVHDRVTNELAFAWLRLLASPSAPQDPSEDSISLGTGQLLDGNCEGGSIAPLAVSLPGLGTVSRCEMPKIGTWEELRGWAQERGWITGGEALTCDEEARFGVLAAAVWSVLIRSDEVRLRGGIATGLLGLHTTSGLEGGKLTKPGIRRLLAQELVDLRLLPDKSANSTLTIGEFALFIVRLHKMCTEDVARDELMGLHFVPSNASRGYDGYPEYQSQLLKLEKLRLDALDVAWRNSRDRDSRFFKLGVLLVNWSDPGPPPLPTAETHLTTAQTRSPRCVDHELYMLAVLVAFLLGPPGDELATVQDLIDLGIERTVAEDLIKQLISMRLTEEEFGTKVRALYQELQDQVPPRDETQRPE